VFGDDRVTCYREHMMFQEELVSLGAKEGLAGELLWIIFYSFVNISFD